MTTRAIPSQAFRSSTPAFLGLLKELFQATPLYLLVASLQSQPASRR